ncbi:unnamed protein product, partial [Thlaspi arvense]
MERMIDLDMVYPLCKVGVRPWNSDLKCWLAFTLPPNLTLQIDLAKSKDESASPQSVSLQILTSSFQSYVIEQFNSQSWKLLRTKINRGNP